MVKKMLFFPLLVMLFLSNLEGGESASVTPKHPLAIIETNYGPVEVVLFPETAPKATENFIRLAEAGSYNNCSFHRVIPNFMIQGGDFTNGNGTGGRSIWGREFEDEFSNTLLFDKPGKLAMANRGKNTNGSQFFITTATTAHLNQKHTIFGQVVKGFENLKKIEALGTPSGRISRTLRGQEVEMPLIKSIRIVPSKEL